MIAPTTVKDPVVITSGFRTGHAAIDLKNIRDGKGLNVFQMATGTVTGIGQTARKSNIITVRVVTSEFNGWINYVHTAAVPGIVKGKIYGAGTVIGVSDNSGHSAGIHLHLFIVEAGGRVVNPVDLFKKFNIEYVYHPDIVDKYT